MERVKVTAPLLPTTIKVTIHRQEPQSDERAKPSDIIITSTQPLPSVAEVINFFTAVQKRRLPRMLWAAGRFRGQGHELNSAIFYSPNIALQEWSDTISECLIQKAACDSTEAATEINHMAAGAYIAFGDSMYKLQPVAVIHTNKALAVMRKLKMEKINAEASGILGNAKLSANAVIAHAASERHEASQVLEKARQLKLPPLSLLLSGSPFRKRERDESSFEVGIDVRVYISSFSLNWVTNPEGKVLHHTYTWKAKISPAVPITFWVPIKDDGAYSISAIHVDRHAHTLPHVDRDKACMEMSDNPPRLLNQEHLTQLRDCIQRLMREVNLSSLLKPHGDWAPEIRHFMPVELLAKMDSTWRWRDQLEQECLLLPGIVTKTEKELESETFNTATLLQQMEINELAAELAKADLVVETEPEPLGQAIPTDVFGENIDLEEMQRQQTANYPPIPAPPQVDTRSIEMQDEEAFNDEEPDEEEEEEETGEEY